MSFDRLAYREAFLTGFKPREQDIDTPYLAFPDDSPLAGETLDGKLKLRGISGAESMEMRKACTINGVTDDAKLVGKLAVKCLYWRAVDGKTGEQITDGRTPFLESTDELEFLGLDLNPFNGLGNELMDFVGMSKASQDAKKNGLELTKSDNSISSLQQDSTGPSANS